MILFLINCPVIFVKIGKLMFVLFKILFDKEIGYLDIQFSIKL